MGSALDGYSNVHACTEMSLLERVSALEAEMAKAKARTAEEVEQFRVAMLGRRRSAYWASASIN